jgi:hypothetical protein
MSRFKSSVLAVATSAALLVSIPAFAQTTGTGSTPTSGTSTAAKRDVTCGKIIELGPDHAVLATDANGNVRILLGDKTRFIARSFGAATGGLKEGDFGAVAGGDGKDGPAHTFLFGDVDFCGKGHAQRIRVSGTISAFAQNYVTVDANDAAKDSYTFRLTQTTKFYVNGKLVQVPDFSQGEAIAVVGVKNAGEHAATPDDPDYTALVVRLRTSK